MSHGRRLLREKPDLGARQVFPQYLVGGGARWPLMPALSRLTLQASASTGKAMTATGWGATDAIALADRLQGEIDSGRARKYAIIRKAELEALPNVPCAICEGTGRRKPAPNSGAGDALTGIKCNGCDGEGYVPNFDINYEFDVDNLEEVRRLSAGLRRVLHRLTIERAEVGSAT